MIRWWREKRNRRELFLKNGSIFLEKLIADSNVTSNPIRFFSAHQILKATNRFDSIDFISAKWYYFRWYKCVIEDRPYAIKIFSEKNYSREWKLKDVVYNDIVISSRVSNQSSFLKLVGCCLEFPIPVLVFECPEYGHLNPRGSLSPLDNDKGPLLPWDVRLKIAKEVAIAVTYLHTAFPRITLHRNIRPQNIVLDENWTAKLTGFSFSITLPEGKTWIEDDQMGEIFGDVEPAYNYTGVVTEYTDVYSFGILMLVLLMGRPAYIEERSNIEHRYILTWLKGLRERGERIRIGPGQTKFLELALRCCEEKNEDRPKMITVAKEIKLLEDEYYLLTY